MTRTVHESLAVWPTLSVALAATVLVPTVVVSMAGVALGSAASPDSPSAAVIVAVTAAPNSTGSGGHDAAAGGAVTELAVALGGEADGDLILEPPFGGAGVVGRAVRVDGGNVRSGRVDFDRVRLCGGVPRGVLCRAGRLVAALARNGEHHGEGARRDVGVRPVDLAPKAGDVGVRGVDGVDRRRTRPPAVRPARDLGERHRRRLAIDLVAGDGPGGYAIARLVADLVRVGRSVGVLC